MENRLPALKRIQKSSAFSDKSELVSMSGGETRPPDDDLEIEDAGLKKNDHGRRDDWPYRQEAEMNDNVVSDPGEESEPA